MKKSKILFTTLVITLILSVFCINAKVFGTDVGDNQIQQGNETQDQSGEPVATAEDEHNHDHLDIDVHEGDLYIAYGENGEYNNGTYVMDKYVDGNAFIFGQNVKITGRINGALYVFASTVTIEEEAYIATDAFIFADTIRMNGFVYDMYAYSRNFEMTKTGTIFRDAKLAAENTVIYGQIGRNVDLATNSLDVYENEETKTYIGGNFNYIAPEKVEELEKITINGETKFTQEKKELEDTKTISDYVYSGIGEIVFAVAIYAIFIFIAPKFIEKSKEYVSTRGLVAAAIGLGFTILVPIIAFLLLLTVIGIPVSLIAIIIYVLALILNSVVVSIAANEFIASKVSAINTIWKKILMIIPVSLVVFIVRKLPLIGGWISAIVLFVGVGIMILYQFDKRKKEKIEE